MNRVLGPAACLAQLFELRNAAEDRHPVDPDRLPVAGLCQLDHVAVGLELGDLDPQRRDGPELVRLPDRVRAVRRYQLALHCLCKRVERGIAFLLLDEQRAIRESDEIDLVAGHVRRLGRDDGVPAAGALWTR
jgi:hypothetical protein